MSTPAQLSPLEQLLAQQQQPQQASQPQQQGGSDLSPLEQLLAKGQQQQASPKKVDHTERAMQQTMGGPPMFVDVPSGDKDQFEKAGQEGYQKGGQIGAGLVGAAGTAALVADPVVTAVASHLGKVKAILDAAGKLGLTGGGIGFGIKEARELYREFSGEGKK